MANIQTTSFENLSFNAFDNDRILLNDANDPDQNIFLQETLLNTSYFTPESAKVSLNSVKDDSFSVIHINIRSLNKNFENFKSLLNQIGFKFKMICITETWCHDDPRNDSIFNLQGYTSVHQVRKHGHTGGGISLFLHNSLMYKMRNDISVNNDDIESLCVEIINKNTKNIIVNTIYRKPTGNIKPFESYLKTFLEKTKCKPTYVTGDLNLNLLDYDVNPKVNSYCNLLFAHNFVPVINKPTRISKHSASLIDHIVTNTFVNEALSLGIIKVDISDHFPVFLISEAKTVDIHAQPTFKIKRTINPNTIAYFEEQLALIDWDIIHNINDPNEAYDKFLVEFLNCYEEAFPIYKVKIKPKTESSPWITKGILKSSKRKQKLYEKYLKNRTILNEQNYKDYKKLFESIKTRSKKNYYRKLIDTYKNDIKRTWDVIKEIIGCKKMKNSSFPKRILIDGLETFDQKVIAEKFNEYFVNVGPNLASKIPQTTGNYKDYLQEGFPILEEYPLSDKELEEAFKSLKLHKSPGYDDISVNVVKKVTSVIFQPLKHIFNISILKGIFPDKMKLAKVTPLFKSGDEALLNNYRPISVLPCFSKLLERIMYNRVYSFLLENEILYEKQFGFQKQHSTEHAIIQLVNQILKSFHEDKYTLGVFIDLSKAFDTVDHHILLTKLSYYGIKNINLKWFKSYLENRKQFISYGNNQTGTKNILCGVPQGSILGPLLFILFVNDLRQATNLLDPIMFADDTNLFCSDLNIKVLFQRVNAELDSINTWFRVNKLSLNANKTKYVLFHKPRLKENLPLKLPDLYLNNIKIKRETFLRFLGVMVDENLTWKKHIELIENKVSKNVGILFKASRLLNLQCLKSIYFSLVHSYINYANVVWASTNRTKLKKILSKQKQAARIMSFEDRSTHARPLMKELNILNVYQINILQNLLFMFKVKNNMAPRVFNRNFCPVDHAYPTRFSANSFQIPENKLNLTRFSTAFRGPSLWNNFLTENEKSYTSLNFFKNKIKEKILDFNNEVSFF